MGPEQGRAHVAGARSEITRVTWVALVTNLLLCGVKLVLGSLGRSQAVVADGVHSLSDTVTDVTVLVGVRFWSAPADEDHPHGHGRIEMLVTAAIGLVLAAVAVGIGYNALATIRDQPQEPPGWVALAAALLSLVVKESLFHWTIRVGQRARSQAVIANAWHQRSDALSSIPAAAAVGVALIGPEWAFVDRVGAVMVAGIILHAAWRIVMPALAQLTDQGASPEQTAAIERIARETPGVREVHAIRSRHIGWGLQVDLHVKVDGAMSVRDGHDISGHVKHRLLDQEHEVVDVIVHLEPFEQKTRSES
jgi:cation diffusion facilitator family transporter